MDSVDLNNKTNTEKSSLRKQYLLLVSMCAIYFFHCFARSSMSANIINFSEEYPDVAYSTIGLIVTFFSISYGVSQILNSFFIKKYNKRFSIFIPLLLEGVLAFLTFFKFDISVYKYIWLGLGISYSFFWMSTMKILSENLDKKLLNRASIFLGFSGGFGAATAYLISSLFTHFGVYRLSFLLGGIILIALAFYFFIISWRYKCSPKEYDSELEIVERKYEKKQRPKYAFIIFIALIIFTIFVAMGFSSLEAWTPIILKDGFGLIGSLSIFLTVVLPIVHSFCTLITVLLHQKMNLKYQIIISAVMFLAVASMTIALLAMKYQIIAMFVVFVSVAYICFRVITAISTSLLPLEMRSYYDSGLYAGILNGACYIGSALSTYVVVLLVEHTSWNYLFILLVAASTFIAITSLCLVLIFRKKEEYKAFI